MEIPKKFKCAGFDINVEFIDFVDGKSTTKIIEKINNN